MGQWRCWRTGLGGRLARSPRAQGDLAMLSRMWNWIELILMVVGFIYTVLVIMTAFILLLPILILFERRTINPKELEK